MTFGESPVRVKGIRVGDVDIPVYVSDALPDDGKVYLMPSLPDSGDLYQPSGFVFFEPEPDTIKGQAIKIVQHGLAAEVAWLRAAGHDMPDWRVQEWRSDWEAWRFDAEVRMSIDVPRPVVIKNIT